MLPDHHQFRAIQNIGTVDVDLDFMEIFWNGVGLHALLPVLVQIKPLKLISQQRASLGNAVPLS